MHLNQYPISNIPFFWTKGGRQKERNVSAKFARVELYQRHTRTYVPLTQDTQSNQNPQTRSQNLL